MKIKAHPDDLTMRYMQRFGCIGEKCEDNCCHGWTVDIDENTQKRMQKLTALHSAEERRRWSAAVGKRPAGPDDKRMIWSLKLQPDGRCPMLEDSGLCHVQGTFGPKLLSDVCAVYPRRVQKVGEAVELSGMVSCPEVARQLLLHADATEMVPLDRSILPRDMVTHGMDPRDVRPYWRLLIKVRTFMLGLLRRPGYSLEERLFFMTWFAKRASPVLNKSVMKADTAAVLGEMEALESDEMLRELAARFNAMEATSAIVVVVAGELVRKREADSRRGSFGRLVDEVFREYDSIRAFQVGDLESPEASSHAARLKEEYARRRARALARSGARVEQYLVNVAHNYWMHRLPLEAPDLMVHMLRLLSILAVLKLLIFSHPSVQADGDDLETRLDAVAVEVLYRVARFIEHSPLLNDLEKLLERNGLRSLAGAVYLIRF